MQAIEVQELEQAEAHGAEELCHECNGNGVYNSVSLVRCKRCGGTGKEPACNTPHM
jgi:DnaJ-class molecular chaperone